MTRAAMKTCLTMANRKARVPTIWSWWSCSGALLVRITNTLKFKPLNLSSLAWQAQYCTQWKPCPTGSILQLLFHPPSVGFTAGCHGPAAGLGPASQTKKDAVEFRCSSCQSDSFTGEWRPTYLVCRDWSGKWHEVTYFCEATTFSGIYVYIMVE